MMLRIVSIVSSASSPAAASVGGGPIRRAAPPSAAPQFRTLPTRVVAVAGASWSLHLGRNWGGVLAAGRADRTRPKVLKRARPLRPNYEC